MSVKHVGKATLALSTALLATVPGGGAQALPAGGGAVVGSVAYDQAIPALGERCAPTSFGLHLDVPVFLLDDGAGSSWGGPVSLAGRGTGGCETQALGGGRVTFAVDAAPGLACGSLGGYYTSIAGQWTLMVSGDCTLDGAPLPRQNWIFTLSVTPADAVAGSVTLLPV